MNGNEAFLLIQQDILAVDSTYNLSFNGYFTVSKSPDFLHWPVSFYLKDINYPFDIISSVSTANLSAYSLVSGNLTTIAKMIFSVNVLSKDTYVK